MYLGAEAFNPSYSLEDDTIISTEQEGNSPSCTYTFNTDGSIDEGGVGSGTTSNVWSNDPGEDGSGHHVRIVSNDSGVDAYVPGSAYGTWVALTSTPVFTFTDADTTGPYNRQSTYTFALSDDGGSTTLDTMTLTVFLANDGP